MAQRGVEGCTDDALIPAALMRSRDALDLIAGLGQRRQDPLVRVTDDGEAGVVALHARGPRERTSADPQLIARPQLRRCRSGRRKCSRGWSDNSSSTTDLRAFLPRGVRAKPHTRRTGKEHEGLQDPLASISTRQTRHAPMAGRSGW